jgi:lactocepin
MELIFLSINLLIIVGENKSSILKGDMSMKQGKMKAFKVMTTVALTSLVFSSFTAFAATNETSSQSQSIEEIVEQGRNLFFNKDKEVNDKDGIYSKDFKKDGLVKPYKPNDLVRLIVEVEQPTEVETSLKNKKTVYKQKQDKVIDQISKTKNSKSPTKVKHRYFEGFNGFSLEIEFQNIEEIQSIPGVMNVHIANTFQPTMGASKELVQAQKVWNQYGYKGEGLLVAVIDSGIDYSHKDMTLTEKGKEKAKWTKENINPKFDETEVNEVWYSDKVPTGYDWADQDTNVIPGEYGSPHGTHVAGTVGANGDEKNRGVEGIAPGVQLLAEKVFSDNGGGAYEDDIIAGIEHAITMGADVINMSLGTDAGYVGEENDPIQKAIRAATENGSLVVVASGNASYSTKNNLIFSSLKPYAENPDIGVVGEPSVSPYALSVASYENSSLHLNTLAEENGLTLPFQDQTQFPASFNFKLSKFLVPETNYELVYVGEGTKKADFYKDNVSLVTGKIVVVKLLNQYSYYSSIQYDTERAGAKAVIIIPPTSMADYPYLELSPYSIPVATTGKAQGDALVNKLTTGQMVKMKLSGDTWVKSPTKNTMSHFSSIGSPHTLDFKPEISAPGGNIYSTVPGNDYEIMSGTSMAAPHVAGGSSLLLQSLYEKGLPHSEDTVLKAKLALMNTANIVMDPRTNGQVPYSPRIQGSGVMQIQNAINTPVIVTSGNTPLEQAGAVALKEMERKTSFKLNLEAFDLPKGNKEDIEYKVYVDVLKDKTEMQEFDLDNDGGLDSKEYLTLTSERINGVEVTVNDKKVTQSEGASIKIKPGQTKMITVNVSLPDTLKKNSFVEGFVRLVPVTKDQDKAVSLSIPYMGFYGKWHEPQNIDPAAWEKDAFLGYTVLWDETSERYPMGYDPSTGRFDVNHIAFSPNFFANGVYATFTSLRNLQKTEMYIEDQSGNIIQNLGDFSEYTGKPWKFRKNIMAYGDYMYGGYQWDMKDQSGQFVPDGVYNYVIKTTLDYGNAKPQEVKMPIKVDSIAPTISDIQVKPKDGKYEISFNAEDNENGSDFNAAIVWSNGEYFELGNEKKSILVNDEPKSIVVLAADYAYNQSYAVWGDPSYIDQYMVISFFYVSPTGDINKGNPAQIISYANNRVDWTINIKDINGQIVDSFEVKNEHTLRTQWTPESDLPNGTYFISADIVTKSGLKVTTTPEQLMVSQ